MGKQESGGSGSFVLGLLVGAGMGATWALLQAPRSGEETRRHLKEAAGELRNEADSVISTAKAHVQQVPQELSEHAETIKAEGEAALQETKEVLTRGAQDVEEEVRSGAAEVQSTVQKDLNQPGRAPESRLTADTRPLGAFSGGPMQQRESRRPGGKKRNSTVR